MPIPQTFQKCKINCGSDVIECALNPQSYRISKTNIWTYKPTNGKDMPTGEFGGGLPMVYELTILLDESLGGPDKNVMDCANKLMGAMHGEGSEPKDITVSWGSIQLPIAKPVSISINYALFRPNGEPIRAFVELELAQAKDGKVPQSQNPTTRAQRGLRVHRVLDGDSLPSIAYRHYGDATRWRTIAEANGISDPLRLRRGTELTVPRIDE